MSAAALYCAVSNVTAFTRPLAVFRITMFLDVAGLMRLGLYLCLGDLCVGEVSWGW